MTTYSNYNFKLTETKTMTDKDKVTNEDILKAVKAAYDNCATYDGAWQAAQEAINSLDLTKAGDPATAVETLKEVDKLVETRLNNFATLSTGAIIAEQEAIFAKKTTELEAAHVAKGVKLTEEYRCLKEEVEDQGADDRADFRRREAALETTVADLEADIVRLTEANTADIHELVDFLRVDRGGEDLDYSHTLKTKRYWIPCMDKDSVVISRRELLNELEQIAEQHDLIK